MITPAQRSDMDAVLRGLRPHVLVEAEAIEALYSLPAACVDLVFADPPYNLSNGGTTNRGGQRVAVDKGAWDASRGLLGDHAFHTRWLAACQRVLKPSGTIWVSGTHHAIFSIGFAMQALGFHVLNLVTWFKSNASPNLACRQFTHSTELLIWAAPAKFAPLPHHFAYRDLKAENGGKQMRDVWAIEPDGEGSLLSIPAVGRREHAEGGKHPTQKPLKLLERIILASSRAGDVVLDPFNGSGTTGVKAIEHRRRYIGIDLDPGHILTTGRRLRALDEGRVVAATH